MTLSELKALAEAATRSQSSGYCTECGGELLVLTFCTDGNVIVHVDSTEARGRVGLCESCGPLAEAAHPQRVLALIAVAEAASTYRLYKEAHDESFDACNCDSVSVVGERRDGHVADCEFLMTQRNERVAELALDAAIARLEAV